MGANIICIITNILMLAVQALIMTQPDISKPIESKLEELMVTKFNIKQNLRVCFLCLLLQLNNRRH